MAAFHDRSVMLVTYLSALRAYCRAYDFTQMQERAMKPDQTRERNDAAGLPDEALESVSGGKIVSKGVLNSSAISLPKPAYPATA
jgi:hypothetical protein